MRESSFKIEYGGEIVGFFENWKEFQVRAERQNLSTACQAAFYWIIAKFNEAHWGEEIKLKDSELMRLAGIRSNRTMADVKSRLKLVGLIDFEASKHYGTKYKLVQLASTAWSEQTAQQTAHQTAHQTAQQTAHQERNSYTHVREDIKTLRQEDIIASSAADAGASARESTLNQEIINLWRGDIGELGGHVYNVLFDLQQRYGVEKVKYAIREGIEIHGATLGVRYVQRVLENPQSKPQKSKGMVRNGNSQSNRTDGDDDINAQYYNLR